MIDTLRNLYKIQKNIKPQSQKNIFLYPKWQHGQNQFCFRQKISMIIIPKLEKIEDLRLKSKIAFFISFKK